MELSQQVRFGHTKTSFTFGDRKLDYIIEQQQADIGFSVLYENITGKRSFSTISEKWPLHLYMAIFAVCLLSFLTDKSVRNFDFSSARCHLWIGLMVANLILMVVQRRFFNIDATLIETTRGMLVVLPDKNQQAIIDEIDSRRKAALKKKYGDVNVFNQPADEYAKFNFLRDQGIITDAEFESATSRLPQPV